MASANLLALAKGKSNRLRSCLEHHLYPIKNTLSLEFVARYLYGYAHWNQMSGNSRDNEEQNTLSDYLYRQVPALIDMHPELGFSLDDLEFEDDVPRLLRNPSWDIAANAIAQMQSDVTETAIPWMSYVANYADPRLQSQYASFDYDEYTLNQVLSLHALMDVEHGDWTIGHYPWDAWETSQLARGRPAQQVTLGRTIFRECYQHQWPPGLKLACGFYDGGRILSQLLDAAPERAEKTLRWLLENEDQF